MALDAIAPLPIANNATNSHGTASDETPPSPVDGSNADAGVAVAADGVGTAVDSAHVMVPFSICGKGVTVSGIADPQEWIVTLSGLTPLPVQRNVMPATTQFPVKLSVEAAAMMIV